MENQIQETIIPTSTLNPTGLDLTAPIYEIHVTDKNKGHETVRLNLEGAVDRIFGHFKSNKLWAVINDSIFKTAAKFSGSSDDNKIIEEDKLRLRNLLSSLTTVDIAFPGQFITPPVQVVGRVIGG